MTNAEKALEFVSDGMTLGLGSGHAAERFVMALGQRARAGLRVRGVPTSKGTEALARTAGVPLVDLGNALPIDITFDGADEVDPRLNLIKGYGHALVREKVVAAASKQLMILIGPGNAAEKLVPALGQRGRVPVEVVPFAAALVRKRIADLGFDPVLVETDPGDPFISDNGNYILEVEVGPIADPPVLEHQLRAIPGVIATGLFLGMADAVIIEDHGTVEVRTRPA